MSPSVQAIRRFLEAHDRFAAHNGITVEDADYDYGKVSLAFDAITRQKLRVDFVMLCQWRQGNVQCRLFNSPKVPKNEK